MDADALVYQSTTAVEVETEWSSDFWTLHSDAAEAKQVFLNKLDTIIRKVTTKMKQKDYRIIMCFSDKENFRKLVYPDYKSNRVGKRKPVSYRGVKKWVEETFEIACYPCCEGDDAIGILATSLENTVIVSIDKDMKTISGATYYDYGNDKFYKNTPELAEYFRYYQTLIGDTCDHYPGCPGIGDKTARKILDENCTWKAVVKTYESKGLTEDDALVQARVARILHASDYDFETNTVILWEPGGVK
jgi:DNA polymerase-1